MVQQSRVLGGDDRICLDEGSLPNKPSLADSDNDKPDRKAQERFMSNEPGVEEAFQL